MTDPRRWSAAEDAALRAGTNPPGRTIEACEKRARSLGCWKPTRPGWTDAEIAVLRRLYKTAARDDVLAALPGRTWPAVLLAAKKLGLSRKGWQSMRGPGTAHPVLKRFRERRLALGVSQAAVSRAAGYGVEALQRVEAGDVMDAKFRTLECLAAALGLKFQLVSVSQPDVTVAPAWLLKLAARVVPKRRRVVYEDVVLPKRVREWAA